MQLNNTMRYERKFRLETTQLNVVHQVVRQHPASFTKAYPDRQVNNIYFDTPDLNCYKDNLIGISQRKKFRVRWYGTTDRLVKKPVLEVKIRDNSLGDKESYKLQDFQLSNLEELTDQVNQHFSKRMELQPVLYNAYQRSYYESYNKQLRLTIDSEMNFRSAYSPLNLQNPPLEDPAVVVELKYPSDQETWAADMMQYLPFRMTKNSKYVNGVMMTNS
ncbi:MAG: polyphosphate polymerase domain-containing protein [Saprospiraceae bacterium]